jgi:hypothetical protein
MDRRGIKMGGDRGVPRTQEWSAYDQAVGNDVVPHPVPITRHASPGRQLTSGPSRGGLPPGLEQYVAGMSAFELEALALQLLQRAAAMGRF